MKKERQIRLKELLVKIYENHQCKREEGESDGDFLTRCGNDMWRKFGTISQKSNIPLAMKQKIVVPIPIKKN
jgi:hypothetical protein